MERTSTVLEAWLLCRWCIAIWSFQCIFLLYHLHHQHHHHRSKLQSNSLLLLAAYRIFFYYIIVIFITHSKNTTAGKLSARGPIIQSHYTFECVQYGYREILLLNIRKKHGCCRFCCWWCSLVTWLDFFERRKWLLSWRSGCVAVWCYVRCRIDFFHRFSSQVSKIHT